MVFYSCRPVKPEEQPVTGKVQHEARGQQPCERMGVATPQHVDHADGKNNVPDHHAFSEVVNFFHTVNQRFSSLLSYERAHWEG